MSKLQLAVASNPRSVCLDVLLPGWRVETKVAAGKNRDYILLVGDTNYVEFAVEVVCKLLVPSSRKSIGDDLEGGGLRELKFEIYGVKQSQ
jgi:hypothetical protein